METVKSTQWIEFHSNSTVPINAVMTKVDMLINCRIQLEQLTVQHHNNVWLQRPDYEAQSRHGLESVNKHHLGTHRWVGVHRVFLLPSEPGHQFAVSLPLFQSLYSFDCALGRVFLLHCFYFLHKQVLRFHVISGSWKSWRKARKVWGTEQWAGV